MEDLSFEGSDLADKHVSVDGKYVRSRLDEIMQKEDWSKFIL